MSVEVTHEKLATISIFQDLSKEALSELAGQCRLIRLSAGENLFVQGDTARTLYLIDSGQIEVMREYEEGETIRLATLGSQAVIGELSMLSNMPRTATVVAATDTVLIALDSDVFFAYLGRYPSMAVQILVQLSRRLHQMNLKLRELGATDPDARLASLILFLAEDQGRIRTGLVTTNFRLQRIARAAGVEMEWLQQTLDDWQEEDYIGLDGRRLLIHSPEGLMEVAGWG